MHCTSPGNNVDTIIGDKVEGVVVDEKKLNHVIVDIEQTILLQQTNNEFQSKHFLDDSEDKIYDDPCELMMIDDWTSPVHIPRSRSWLCCPNRQSDTEPVRVTNKNSCEYSLITDQPKAQNDSTVIKIIFAQNNFVYVIFISID